MTAILIADTSKSSIVMTSEIFKDKILGATIDVVGTGEECVNIVCQKNFDLIVLDFDLPDADGVSLCKLLRQHYNGPVLITAFPDKIVQSAIENELFPYNDAMDWIPKPVRAEALNHIIQKYLLDKKRVQKRYITNMDAALSSPGDKKGLRTERFKGNVINISIGGALLQLDQGAELRNGEEISLTLYHSAEKKLSSSEQDSAQTSIPKTKTRSKTKGTNAGSEPKNKGTPTLKTGSSRLKAKIAWADQKKHTAGISFLSLTESNRKVLEVIMKESKEAVPDARHRSDKG